MDAWKRAKRVCATLVALALTAAAPASAQRAVSSERTRHAAATSTAAGGAVRYVDADATGANDGTSWTDAFTSLQDALADAAGSGGTVTELWVAAGIYRPDEGASQTPGDRTATFQLLDGLAIYGGFAGTETMLSQRDVDVNETILSGDLSANDAEHACTVNSPDCDSNGGLCVDGFCIIANNNGENSYHVVTGSGTDATAVLNGFTITAGNANGAAPDKPGAGMYNSSGSPTVMKCTFRGNSAGSNGGGMYNTGSDPTLANCLFSGNAATIGGGAIYASSSLPEVISCSFRANTAADGGAIYSTGASVVTIIGSIFSRNSASNDGGALYSGQSDAVLTNCTLSKNIASSDGGGVFRDAGTGVLTFTNSIFWNNADAGGMDESAQIRVMGSSPTVNYSIVQGGWTGAGGTGNSASDPLFVDPDGADDSAGTEDDDLRLRNGSPAIDAADTTALPADTADLDGDGDTSEPVPLDLDGHPRVIDDPQTPDTGVPGSAVADMGAYEFGLAVLVEDFDDAVLDPRWSVSFGANADDWTFSEAGTELSVTDISTITSYCNDMCPGWGYARLARSIPYVGDFHVDFDFSWDSLGLYDAMQLVTVFLVGIDGQDFAWVSYVDAWGPNVVEFGRQFARIGGAEFTGPNDLPLAGSASIDINRVGDDLTIRWNGTPILTGTASALLAGVRIEFGHFDEIGADGGGVTCPAHTSCNLPADHPASTFGVLSADQIRVQGSAQPVRYVDRNATGLNNGATWTDAYTSLQDALADAAGSGGAVTQIWVAAGTYTPDQGAAQTPGDRTATFQLLNGVAIYGGFAGGETLLSERDVEANETILSGDLNGDDSLVACTQSSPDCDANGGLCFEGSCIIADNNDENTYHVVTGSGTNVTAGLDGFTITGGNADAGSPNERGAGMFNDGGSPTVTNCTFSGNSASFLGGGMYNVFDSSPTVTNCTFSGNSADFGGGMHNVTNSSPTVTNCTFSGNSAGSNGGGMRNFENSSPTVTNCTFSGNSAASFGGVMENHTSSPTVTNCTFSGNSAGGNGGGMFNFNNSSPAVTNCVLWGNSDSGGMGESAQIHTDSGTPTVNYSIVQGGWTGAGGTGVLGADPLFVDADGPDNVPGTEDDDLRLMPGSPAIDAGDTTALPADAADLDDDGDTAETLPLDLAGKPRVVDDPTAPDTGVPGSAIVDIGAFESQGSVRFVRAGAAGENTGESWADAYPNLQDALADAGARNTDSDAGNDIEQLWVAAGTYYPDEGGDQTLGDRSATFQLLNGVALYGGFAGTESMLSERDIEVNETILSGDLNGDDTLAACTTDSPDCDSFGGLCGDDGFCIIAANNDENSYHVVTGSGTDATAVIDGFTIRDGHANGAGAFQDNGAGMLNQAGSPAVANCTFMANAAAFEGGGMYNNGGSTAIIDDCTFRGNTAVNGGGVYSISSTPTVINSIFISNLAVNAGGGIDNNASSTVIINCTFTRNASANLGGGMSNGTDDQTVTNCKFNGNSALNGAGMGNINSDPAVTNCTFYGNAATNVGGAIYASSSSPVVTGCILWGNIDDSDGDIGGPFADESAQIHTSSGTPTVNYSIVEGGWTGAGGTGNSASDPLFVDADGPDNVVGTEDDDLRLRAGSPAIDAADTTALPADAADLNGNGNTTERIPWDLAGNPRVVDDPNTLDTGVPGSPVVDMGAFEFFPDCNRNGVPDDCDVDCNALSGTCNIPGCGQGSDCNANGTPDACDIEVCDPMHPDFPGCDDCNVNGVPDACDIADMTSDDVDSNGVPDECFEPVAAGNSWSDDIWGLSGDYPDNAGGDTFHVTVDDQALVLDVTVSINTLRVLDAASLDVTGGDLSVVAAGGTRVGSRTTPSAVAGGSGNTLLVGEDNVMTSTNLVVKQNGDLLVEDNAQIHVSDRLTIDAGGTYQKNPADLDVTTAELTAGTATIIQGQCSPFIPPGAMYLTDSMVLTTNGDLILDGRSADPFCVGSFGGAAALRGGQTPPVMCIGPDATTRIRRKLIFRGAVTLCIIARAGASSLASAAAGSGQPTIILGGDFVNESLYPSTFQWDQAKLVLDKSISDNPLATLAFEVGGLDLGQSAEGFQTDRDTLFDTRSHANFAIGTLEVAQNTSVRLVNLFANTAGSGAFREALYVDRLVLQSGSTVILDQARIYYNTLENNGGTIVGLPCPVGAGAIAVRPPANRVLSVQTPQAGDCNTAVRVRLKTLYRTSSGCSARPSGPALSAFDGAIRWLGPPAQFPDEASPPMADFLAAPLQCCPYFRDWSRTALASEFANADVSAVHAFGAAVVPCSSYELQVVKASCTDLGRESCYSPPLTVTTALWGDTWALFGLVNVTDITKLVDKFRGVAYGPGPAESGAPPKVRAMLRGNVPPLIEKINVTDITKGIDAFRGLPYTEVGPSMCTSSCP